MKIIKIKHEQKTGRSGKQFESCQILTENSNGEETWISGFGSEITRTWRAGDDDGSLASPKNTTKGQAPVRGNIEQPF